MWRVKVHVANHPLISHKLTVLRDENTNSPTFRQLTEELVMLLAYEATREIRTESKTIKTPVEQMQGSVLTKPRPVVVPILRAGLGMLEGMTRLIPSAEVGFLGMIRDHETLQPTTYANRLPDDLTGRQCYVLDPMLATGGTLIAAMQYLLAKGARDITAICILAAPEGIAAVEKELGGKDLPITIVTAALDQKLNEKGYIVPGLGDAGDRLRAIGVRQRRCDVQRDRRVLLAGRGLDGPQGVGPALIGQLRRRGVGIGHGHRLAALAGVGDGRRAMGGRRGGDRLSRGGRRGRRRGVLDDHAADHRMVADAAELVADDAEVASFVRRHAQAVVIARQHHEVHVDRVEREPVRHVERRDVQRVLRPLLELEHRRAIAKARDDLLAGNHRESDIVAAIVDERLT